MNFLRRSVNEISCLKLTQKKQKTNKRFQIFLENGTMLLYNQQKSFKYFFNEANAKFEKKFFVGGC